MLLKRLRAPVVRRNGGMLGALLLMLFSLAPLRAQERAQATPQSYRLQPGDEIAISVVPQKEFDSQAILAPDGMLYLKNVGEVAAAGMTIPDLTRHVTRALAAELKGHRVTIALVRRGKSESFVRIGGQVHNPRTYELKPGMTLTDLIEEAGKLTHLADVTKVELKRRGGEVETLDLVERHRMGLRGEVMLEPGDAVWIHEQKDVVFVLGMIQRAGPRALRPGQTISDFFKFGGEDLSGATNDLVVDVKNVQVLRPGRDKPVTVNLRDVLAKPGHKDNVQLQSGDVIFLPSKKQPKRGVLEYVAQLGPLAGLMGLF